MKVLFSGNQPKQFHPSDAGFDLVASEGGTVQPQKSLVVKTGTKIALPRGWHADVRPRSGLTSKGVFCQIGLIDSGYRGEIFVTLHNITNFHFNVSRGDRIAQLVIVKDIPVEFVEGEMDETDRGEAGMGSTGIR